MTSKVLTCHQAFWDEFLSEFYFSTTYCPGHIATLPDALSRWDNIYLDRGEDFISKSPMIFQQLIKKDEVQTSLFVEVKVEPFSNLIESTQKALWRDSQYIGTLQYWVKGKLVENYSLYSSFNLLFFKDWLVVPNDTTIQHSILQNSHDSPLAGHPGQEITLKLFKRYFSETSNMKVQDDCVKLTLITLMSTKQ
ncbi:hypothetical protein O181_116422 [Austropuccinia psidii MF-1]|uniref:Integrase zinc-binding domain-containing protein n=1 Tax=Austropuccinia psidii MF-1 TaxID=1389203 RepID=A0A9Q3KBE2_9BASI|nr:hypothetical protein [Austropuccinia psidii MF-1]